MTEETIKYNLLQMVMKKTRLPWRWATAVAGAVLFLLLVLAVLLDGKSPNLSNWGFWQNSLSGLLLIIYILIIPVFMWRLRERAIQAFRPLLPLDEDDFNRLAAEVARPKRRWEWTSVLLGVGFAVVLGQPWVLPWGPGDLWGSVYLVIAALLMNGLLAWLIYDTLTGAVRINRLSRREMKLDIFNTEVLTPVALWSLGISLGFVGGISLSLVFQTQESLLRWQNIITYVILVGVTLLMFFLSMWSAHSVMAEAKNRKLAMARKHLAATSSELEDLAVEGQHSETQGLAATINSWAAYYRLIQEAPTWPFNADIVRRLFASATVPVIVYLVKIFTGLGIRF